jgi:hypothetical protein
VGLAGVGISPALSQLKTGVPFTPGGREMEQVSVRVSPAMIGEGGVDSREMLAGTAYGDRENS